MRGVLISHSRKFVYIHVNRTGGSSFASVLEPHVDHRQSNARANKLLSSVGLQRDPKRVHFRAHDSALAVQRRWPREMFDAYYKFAFVRNPCSWLVSLYFRFGTTTSHRHHRHVSKMSFAEYVAWEVRRDKRHQHRFVCDEDGALIVDFVGRLERLHADLASAYGFTPDALAERVLEHRREVGS